MDTSTTSPNATADAPPSTLPVRPHAIPAELRERDQWVAWRWERRGDKWTKVPVNPRTGQRAESDNPATWSDFATALAYAEAHPDAIAGVGYVFSPDDPFTGIDFDDCRDPETGTLDQWAAAMLAEFASYAEASPSERGIKVFVRASLPGNGIRRKRPDDIPGGMVEMYDGGRYFTVTGHHLVSTPAAIRDAQEAVDALYARLTADKPRAGDAPPPANGAGHDDAQQTRDTTTDEELIAFASQAQNGAKFTALWMGNIAGYSSRSEADLALCSLLAFYTGPDAARIDRLFRRSLLMRPKWDERHGTQTYGALTIARALGQRTAYWQPGERYAEYREEHTTDGGETQDHTDGARPWTPVANARPAPLAKEAFQGLAGDFVRLVAPESEADPAAILTSFLVLAGNCMGRSPYFLVENTKHHTNLFAATVGDSSVGRKGVALDRAKQPFALAEMVWLTTCVAGGLSSAEGLIWQVHDPIFKWEKGKDGEDGRQVQIDPGAPDKRFCATETEFASILRHFQRDGNTLSPVVRKAFDSGDLRSLTKNSPARATGAHISMLAHITKTELLRHLDDTEAANGFGNRFLWIYTERSQFLPDGGGAVDLSEIALRLSRALTFARRTGEMMRDDEARALWHAVYRPLSEGKPGLLGAMIARAAPLVLRLSMIYALLDCSKVIRKEHLTAAIALWEYAEASARFIFGDALGDPVADELLAALRRSPDGLTRTEISDVLGRNQRTARIARALVLLAKNGLARSERTGGGPGKGQPVERWFATTPGDRSSSSSPS